MNIGIVGAGSIGGWIAARLAGAGHSVSVLARGDTLAAINAQGLRFCSGGSESTHMVKASNDPAVLGQQDVLVLSVKAQSLPTLAPTLAPIIGAGTIIIPMLNGVPWWFLGEGVPLRSVDPDGSIAAAFPHNAVLGCVVHASAFCPEPGITQLKFADKLIIGEPDGSMSKRLDSIIATFRQADVPAVATENIRKEIWYKLWGNMTINPISALTLATADRILDDELVNRLILAAMSEAKAIGSRIRCSTEQSGEDRNDVTRKLGAFKTSMLQDVEAGRSIELDALLAAPCEIARKHGLETPTLDALFGLARLMGQSRGLY